MLKYVATAVAALAVLGGCDSSNQSASTQAPAGNGTAQTAANGQIADTITGTVSLREPMAISADAKLTIKLVDVAMQDTAVAESDETVNGQPPYQFSLKLDPAKIDRTRTYVLNALLIDGDRRFVPALQFPVLTGGAGAKAEIVLNTEATPGEKLKSELTKLKSNIGGMKRIQNAFLDGDLSVAWDGFVEADKVRFMRVNSEKGDGDTAVRSEIEYAFLDDKPMGVLRKGSVVTRLGWDGEGNLILNEKTGGGSATEDEAKALYADAVRVLAMGQTKLPKKK